MAKTKKCPVCGISTRIENLEKHLKKVYPQEKIDLKYSKKEKDELKQLKENEKLLTAISKRKMYAGMAILTVIIIAASLFLYLPSIVNPGKPPEVQTTHTSFDFGLITDPTTITHEFTFKNNGSGILEINKIETSCHCTNATLEVNGDVSGPFGMDGSPGSWMVQMNPGESATLTVYYNTLYHPQPDTGEQVRYINVYTNDAANPVVKFDIKAYIVRS